MLYLIATAALIAQAIPALPETPAPAAPPAFIYEIPDASQPTALAYPSRWIDLGDDLDDPADDVVHPYDGNKYPLAGALVAAAAGDVIEVYGTHRGVEIGGNKDGHRRPTVPVLADGVTIQGGDENARVDSIALVNRWHGDLTVRDVHIEAPGKWGLIAFQNTRHSMTLRLWRVVFEDTSTLMWPVRLHGIVKRFEIVECVGLGSNEHGLAYWDNCTDVIAARNVGYAAPNTLLQGTVRLASGPAPGIGGEWWIVRNVAIGLGNNGSAFTMAGSPQGGRLVLMDNRTINTAGGGIAVWTDRKMKDVQNGKVVGPGHTWTGANGVPGYGHSNVDIVNYRHDGDRTGNREGMQLSQIENLRIWNLPRRRGSEMLIDSDGARGVTLGYYAGPPIGELLIYSRVPPSTWYVRNGWRDGGTSSAPVVNPDDFWAQ